MADIANPEIIENSPIIVPKEASQLFGAYLRQEFKEPLETIGQPHIQRLVNFINNLEMSKEVKLVDVKQDGFMDFEFSTEKDNVPTANNFTMSADLTPHFLSAIDHNVRNALFALVAFDEKMPFKMTSVLTDLSNATQLKMSRENGKVKVIPLSQKATVR